MMASTKQGKQDNQSTQQGNRTSQRGFASMDPNQQRAIASEGGRAAHRSGNAHEFTSEEARKAGSMSHKNSTRQKSAGNQGSESSGNQSGSSMHGGSSEQHAASGHQSHKDQK
jgi:hypothetical protein